MGVTTHGDQQTPLWLRASRRLRYTHSCLHQRGVTDAVKRLLPILVLFLCGCTKHPAPITETPAQLKWIAENLPQAPRWTFGQGCTYTLLTNPGKGQTVECDEWDGGAGQKVKQDSYPIAALAETTYAFNKCQAAMTVTETHFYSHYFTHVESRTDQFSVSDLDPSQMQILGGHENEPVELVLGMHGSHGFISESHTNNSGIDGGTSTSEKHELSIPYASKDQAYEHTKAWREAIRACGGKTQ